MYLGVHRYNTPSTRLVRVCWRLLGETTVTAPSIKVRQRWQSQPQSSPWPRICKKRDEQRHTQTWTEYESACPSLCPSKWGVCRPRSDPMLPLEPRQGNKQISPVIAAGRAAGAGAEAANTTPIFKWTGNRGWVMLTVYPHGSYVSRCVCVNELLPPALLLEGEGKQSKWISDAQRNTRHFSPWAFCSTTLE